MAVILQEVFGRRHGPRYYPDVSGVARSYNFYPTGQAEPEEGVVDLALGLGKTIVDGGRAWTYSPAHPSVGPPFGSVEESLELTQTDFWAVNMGHPPVFDPLTEAEYLVKGGLPEAEADGALRGLASTYDPQSGRLSLGLRGAGPRVLSFAPLLQLGTWPLNDAVRGLLALFAEHSGSAPEQARGGPPELWEWVIADQALEITLNRRMPQLVLGNGNGTPALFRRQATRVHVA